MHTLKLFFIILLCPLLIHAQSAGPTFKNDTAYSIGGYPIYKNQVLHFGKGSGKNGQFKYVSTKNGIPETALINNTILVTDLKNFGKNDEDKGYIDITGSIVFKDSTKGTVEIKLFIDKAIQNDKGTTGELIIPATFINNSKVIFYNELKRLLDLYISGTIDRVTYETQKQKLLDDNNPSKH
jgi:hypothetical protein